jgi:transposase
VRWGEAQSCAAALESLVRELMEGERLVVGQEVGTMACMVYDAITAAGAEVLSFNAQQLRMIASSRKKTDRRDAYWIARALQTGMHPHPVYIPTGEIRELRCLLKRRRMVLSERARWHNRGRATLRAAGQVARCRPGRLGVVLKEMLGSPQGVDAHVAEMIELCQRQRSRLDYELRVVEAEVRQRAREIEPIKRLQTPRARLGPWSAPCIGRGVERTVSDMERYVYFGPL